MQIFFSQKKVIVQFQRQNRLMDLKEVQLIILSQCFGSIENEIYFSEIKSFTEALARYYN
jgi:hypothetical protein